MVALLTALAVGVALGIYECFFAHSKHSNTFNSLNIGLGALFFRTCLPQVARAADAHPAMLAEEESSSAADKEAAAAAAAAEREQQQACGVKAEQQPAQAARAQAAQAEAECAALEETAEAPTPEELPPGFVAESCR